MDTVAIPPTDKPLIMTSDDQRREYRPRLDEAILAEVGCNARAVQAQIGTAQAQAAAQAAALQAQVCEGSTTNLGATKDAQYQMAVTVEHAVNNLTAQQSSTGERLCTGLALLQKQICDASTAAQIGLREVEGRLLTRVTEDGVRVRELVVQEADKTRQLVQQVDRDNLNRRVAELHAENLHLRTYVPRV
jgi:hypothetical protein